MPYSDPNKQKAAMKVIRDKRHQQALDFLLEHPCVDCGEDDPVVLEFDHIHGDKLYSISDLISRYASESKLKAEIAKCVVRCANCHRRKTAKQLKYFRYSSVA